MRINVISKLLKTLCILLWLLYLAGSVSAESYGKFTYTVFEGAASITGTGYTCGDSEVEIPSEIGGYPVISIGYRAFYDCSSLTRISIPSVVTSIEGGAFENCTQLSEVNISEGVARIEGNAFRNCRKLTSLILPESIVYIGEAAFRNSGLTGMALG